MNLNVFAVVVTFNRPAILRACLDSLFTQIVFGLERIHVVVNSKDDQTALLLQSYKKEPLLTYEFLDNPGPAGGFNAGLQRFIQEGKSYVWLMDDDVVVKNDCLKHLLDCTTNQEFVWPKVIAEDGKELGLYGWWGVLLSKRIVEKAGYPLTNLFYWTEDTEYLQHRIRRIYKITPFRCRAAIVQHLHKRTKKRPSWYYYYVTRNTLYYRFHIMHFTWHRLSRTLILIPSFFIRIILKEDNKAKKFKLMLYGVYHGVIGKIGKLVDPSLNQ